MVLPSLSVQRFDALCAPANRRRRSPFRSKWSIFTSLVRSWSLCAVPYVLAPYQKAESTSVLPLVCSVQRSRLGG